MKILVAGATGATGRLVVDELLGRGYEVTAIVRSADRLPAPPGSNTRLTVIEANLLATEEPIIQNWVADCDAVISCLGHNISWKGMYGKPRRLVTDSVSRLCEAIHGSGKTETTKFVLMNTTGNRNRDITEKRFFGERVVLGLIRLLLPPHSDNEHAADFLRTRIGQSDEKIEWVAVRPDSLLNHEKTSEYSVHPSPVRSPIFNAGKTTRINVAHFMAELLTDRKLWSQWSGRMPVIYNKDSLV